MQVQNVAEPRGHEILVIACMAQQEHASIVDQIRVGTDVEVKIRPHPAASENADLAGKALWHMPGSFQRFPCGFKELAVLRIHDRRLFGRKPEELRIELCKTVKRRTKGHVVAMTHQAGVFTRSPQVFLREAPDRRFA